MKITVYDGAETIGGNKIYVEENGGVFLDFGMNFAKYSKYFAEFLNERSTRGIHDSLYLNLIPELNIYRTDLIPSDVDISRYPELNVEAVLLSHAHMDHCGNVGFLHENIPIVASATTLAVLKAMRDSGRMSGGGEIIYHSPRKPLEDGRVLKSSNSPKDPYVGRNVVCVDKLNDRVKDFLCFKPGQESNRAKKLKAGEVCCIDDRELPFDVKAFEIDHSIYGAVSYILYGDTAIAYTGDIRLHGKRGEETRKFVKRARDAQVLIIEGTRTGREEDINVSEQEVFENCLKAVEESKGLIIADFSPRNFERLETFREIAAKTSRQLVVTAKDAYMLQAIELVDGVDRMKGVGIYGELKDRREKWETEVVMNRENSYVDPVEIKQNPENYILCFSYYDMKHLLDIKPDGGVYIYSASEAFTEEQEFDFLRLYNWLETFGFEIYGFEMVFEGERPKPRFIKGYHASGHASKDDLMWMIEEIDPDIIIPVHTENPGWFSENFEGVRLLKDGESIEM
jgi:ribonuclease J